MPYTIIGGKELPSSIAIDLPYSKSIVVRQLFLSYLKGKPYPPSDLGEDMVSSLVCQDIRLFDRALRELSTKEDTDEVTLDCGCSATAMRFFIVLSLYRRATTALVGSDRLLSRIEQDDLSFISQLGGECRILHSQDSIVLTPPKGLRSCTVSAHWTSSQYLSAFALCNRYRAPQVIAEHSSSLSSSSYYHLTLELLQRGERAHSLERDWSAAAFWYQLLATSPTLQEISFPHLSLDSLQPDSRLSQLFQPFGLQTSEIERGIIVRKVIGKSPSFAPLVMDISQNLDLFLPLACTAFTLGIPFTFKGIQNLRQKECNRVDSLVSTLTDYYHTSFSITPQQISWNGHKELRSQSHYVTYPFEDHRTVMSTSMFATLLPLTTEVSNPEVVEKSYPTFFDDLSRIMGQ